MGPGHPEQPGRLSAIRDRLRAGGLDDFLVHYEAPRATVEQLGRVHEPALIERLQALAPDKGHVAIDPDTHMNSHSWEAALRAAGAVVLATELAISGQAPRSFCNVRPPGHHAERARAMGFCLFNNIAVGAAHALEAHRLRRVAIVDFDVHFGNGTADIFDGDARILMCSTYQHPFYPGHNPPSVPDRQINCPLPAGSDGEALRDAVESLWMPALERFRPEMLFVSAGFDAAAGDLLGGLRWSPADYEWLTDQLCSVASRHAQGRVVSALEGGYELDRLAACTAAHVGSLMRN